MKLNQKAFSNVEILLTLILVAILGFTGFYVYNANKNTNATYKAASQDASGTPKYSAKNVKYLSISEWSVRAPITNDITYTMDDGHADFRSATVASYSTTCDSKDNLGEFYRLNPGDTFGDEKVPIEKIGKKIGGHYYYYQPHDEFCTSGIKMTDDQDKFVRQLLGEVNNFQDKFVAY